MFRKVLIANRGEIAIRIAQTLQQMGIAVVAIHSDADRRALHVQCADEAHALAGNNSAETYLDGGKIIDIARRHSVDAIHPGYGFLSENADFAEACADAGITFIGPSPGVIRDLGDKIIAKEKFKAAGVPVVPGAALDFKDSKDGRGPTNRAGHVAAEIGYPVMIKAAAGGGGKGMRRVESDHELAAALEAAEREASGAFGDGRLFIEKCISRPRHVEFQIMGDTHDNLVHLFERECSIQRRHQKIIEESPSPALSPGLRRRMGQAAVRAALAVGYTNAGTVEFMLDEAGNFYFLEVNTRLQVEHPVTEMVVRHDLVHAQILVAAGQTLPFNQDDLDQRGHALECRIYAEDASRDFLPSTGTIADYCAPSGPNIRVDSGVSAGSEVSVYYDPMLAKLVVWGRDRAESIARMDWALAHFVILGITTNIDFLRQVLAHSEFRAGSIHTGFLEEHDIARGAGDTIPDEALIAAAIASGNAADFVRTPCDGSAIPSNPWQSAGRWRAF